MTLGACSVDAYNSCPKNVRCASIKDAFYCLSSACAKHNENMRTPKWVQDEEGFFHCSHCDFTHSQKDWTTSQCPECGSDMSGAILYEAGELPD